MTGGEDSHVSVFHYPGATFVLYDNIFKSEEQPILSALKTAKDDLGKALVGRKEAVLAAAHLLEEHPRASEVTIDVFDEDARMLDLLEGKTTKPSPLLHLKVARLRVPVVEDPRNIVLELLLQLMQGEKGDMVVGQVILDLPPPFVCETWSGEAVSPD